MKDILLISILTPWAILFIIYIILFIRDMRKEDEQKRMREVIEHEDKRL